MAWEWVSPTATAAVGIAAVGFAYLTTRRVEDARARDSLSLRKHERDLIVRRERLETFALFLGTVDAFDRAIYDASLAMKKFYDAQNPDWPGPPAIVATMHDRIAELNKHYSDVLLVGTGPVRDAARLVRGDCLDAWGEAVKGDQDPRFLLGGPRELLTIAMREDLGYED